MMTPFAHIIEDLASMLRMPLHIDALGSCSLIFYQKILVQFQLDKTGKKLLIGGIIGEISPGKFRENVLQTALIANDRKERIFSFGYHPKENKLIAFHYFPLYYSSKELLQQFLSSFVDQALIWHEALQSGNLSALTEKSRKLPHPFGMIP
ncbi:MAG: CesT family type III secretion system chaperone [Parachlamydiales bacterium]|nr:CesT family type III secretion system chaperone [Parachlamydiales bacterium]